MAITRKNKQLIYKPMQDYLASHNAMIQSIKGVRDVLLHPLRETSYEGNLHVFANCASEIASSYLEAILETQHIVDDYLQWLKESFSESVVEDTVALTNEQLVVIVSKDINLLTEFLKKSKNREEKKAIDRYLGQRLEFHDFLVKNFNPSYRLTSTQQHEVDKWRKVGTFLVLAFQNGLSIQTPIPFRPQSTRIYRPLYLVPALKDKLLGPAMTYLNFYGNGGQIASAC